MKAAGASTLDVDKLGDAVLAAGGAAKASGVDYQDFITTMGLISGSFLSAAEAGTSYKNFLTRLIPTTQSQTDAMVALGLATEDGKSLFYDASGAFVGNRQAAEMLKQALSGLSDEERSGALATIFGNDAKNAAIALMGQGAVGYDNFAASMAKANGVAEQSAATQRGFNFAMQNFQGTVEALQISLGEALLPILTDFLGYANQGVSVVMGFANSILQADNPLKALTQYDGKIALACMCEGIRHRAGIAWCKCIGHRVAVALQALDGCIFLHERFNSRRPFPIGVDAHSTR